MQVPPRQETLGKVRQTGALPRPARRHRLFALGLAEWLACWVSGRPLPIQKLGPQPWADEWHDVPTLTENQLCSNELYP